MDIFDRKQAWLDRRNSKIPPGKTEMWFGKHKGSLFEDLSYHYMESLLNLYHKGSGILLYRRE
jgi:hypothetical protein